MKTKGNTGTKWPAHSKSRYLIRYIAKRFEEMGYSEKEAEAKVNNYTGVILGGCQRELTLPEIVRNVYDKFAATPRNYLDVWDKKAFQTFASKNGLKVVYATDTPYVPEYDGIKEEYDSPSYPLDENLRKHHRALAAK